LNAANEGLGVWRYGSQVVKARKVDSDMTVPEPLFDIRVSGNEVGYLHRVTSLTNGDFVVLYDEVGIDSFGSGIMVQKVVGFANSGAPVRVNTVDACKYLFTIISIKMILITNLKKEYF